MRRFLLIAALACPVLATAAERTYIHEFYDARKLQQTDQAGAAEGMIRCFHLAIGEGNSDYAAAAASNACLLLYQQGKEIEAGKFARASIEALQPFPPDGPDGDAVRRTSIFGYLERGLLTEGKIGAAWQANRAAAETLRGKKVGAAADGRSITVAEVIHLAPKLRSLGWRLIERESELLDLAGRSVEACALLDEAAAFLQEDWQRLAPNEHFYAFKLLAARAMIVDFLGYELDALEAQQSLLETPDLHPEVHPTRLNLRLNLQRNLSQWHGPSEEILAEARKVGAELKSTGTARGTDRLLAKMELDLRDSREALAALRDDARHSADRGHWLEAVYGERDSLLGRANTGEDGLDGEFNRLLARMRAQGNKRGEPNLYREYGDYLLEKGRPAEAIATFSEALRLTRSFGWTLHEPAILSDLFNARFSAGDLAGARATLEELEAFLKAHPELPVVRRVRAEVGRAIALSKLGETDAVKSALSSARELGRDLPDYQKRWLTPEAERRILEKKPAPPSPGVAVAPSLRVQPLEITSIAPPGGTARTRFSLFNPTLAAIRGHLEIQGPGAEVNAAGDDIRFEAGKATVTVKVPRRVPAGGESAIGVSLAAAAGVEAAQVKVAWQHDEQATGPATTWDVSWDPAATGSVVLDASSLEASPFRSVSLFHELAVPAGVDGVAFRLRSPVPLRLEYYASRSQELVAIDANGNGDFTEPGDLHVRDSRNVTAAILPVPPGGRNLTVEVRIFAIDGRPLAPEAAALVLEAEVHRGGGWVKEAEDTLK